MRYRWFAGDEDERRDEFGVPKVRVPAPTEDASERKLSRAERSGMLISAVVFAYGLMTRDIPIIFVAVAFLTYEAGKFTFLLGESRGKFWGSVLRSFSISLFVGALMLMFLR